MRARFAGERIDPGAGDFVEDAAVSRQGRLLRRWPAERRGGTRESMERQGLRLDLREAVVGDVVQVAAAPPEAMY